jgi:hypothetical protein
MAPHTPGPWRLEAHRAEGSYGLYDEEGYIFAEVQLFGGERDDANTRLVAAAPELLEALKVLIKDIDDWERAVKEIIGRFPNTTWGNLEEARRVVARAERRHE